MNARIVAALHDVIEDTAWTAAELAMEGFSHKVLSALAAVTKRPEEEGGDAGYLAFSRRAGSHPIGREVKRADLVDNRDLGRLGTELTERSRRRLERYQTALRIVESME